MTDVDEALRIVAQFQESLRLHEADVKHIVYRFSYLKQQLGTNGLKGFPDLNILLTSIYYYVRDPNNGRKIVSPHKFVSICRSLGFVFSGKDLWRYGRLYFEHERYSRAPVSNALVYFEAAWHDISKNLSLDEHAKDQLLSLLKKFQTLKKHRGSPWIVTAAAIYLFDKKRGHYRTQWELSDFFGISEVSLRTAAKDFEPCME